MALKPPPLGLGILDEQGMTAPSWLRWFQDVYANGLTARPLIQSQSVTSNTTEIDLTEGINSTYDRYRIIITDLHPTASNAKLQVVVSTDGGTTYETGASDYESLVTTKRGSSDTGTTLETDAYSSSASSLTCMDLALGNTVNDQCEGRIDIIKPSNSDHYTRVKWRLTYTNSSGDLILTQGQGRYKANTAVNAIRLKLSSGSIASADIKLYGLK